MSNRYRSAALFTLLTLSAQISLADVPQINVRELGLLDRVVKYCAPVDADITRTLQGKLDALLKGATPNAVAQARSSEDYKQAYATMDGFVAQVDPRNAKIVCTDAAKTKK